LEAHLKWIAWLCAAIVAGTVPACADILIGVAGPFSGQYASLGNQLRIGVESAVADANAAGGINGENLSVMALDDVCDTRKAVDAARQFATQDVRLVVGHYCSGTSAAAALVYKEAGILMITPSASQPALTDARNWNVFRMTGRDDAPYTLAAHRISSDPDAPKAAIVSTLSPQNQSLVQSVTSILPGALQLTVKLGAFNSTATAQQLVGNGVQSVIVLLPSNEAATLAASLIYAGFQGEIYGGDQFLSEDFASGAGDVGYIMLAAFPEDPMANVAAISVVSQFVANGVTPEGATLSAYAAVQAFVAAAKARSVNDGPAMADWLRSGNVVDTVLGKVTFDSKGDLARQPFAWYRWLGAARRFAPE
jgi:branched-chain amino acid transport system substrate-binding protein